MKRKILGAILQIPLVLVVIGSFIASIYAAMNKIANITYAVSVIFGVVIVLYFLGVWLKGTRKSSSDVIIKV